MSGNKMFYTGLSGRNAIEAYMRYDKNAGGYAVVCNVGDYDASTDLFGWWVDGDYFKFYQRPAVKVIVPATRRNAKKEQAAKEIFEKNALDYVREFAAAAEQLGAPHMEITEAA